MRGMIKFLILTLMFSGCTADGPPPYGGLLWGDPCDHDRPLPPRAISGCTHASDGSGDSISPGRDITLTVGICAADDACRPMCGSDGTLMRTCPAGSTPTMIGSSDKTVGFVFCYCDVTPIKLPSCASLGCPDAPSGTDDFTKPWEPCRLDSLCYCRNLLLPQMDACAR